MSLNVEVLTKPGCSACVWTKKALESLDIDFTMRDVTQDSAAYDTVVELGYQQMPVVVVNGGEIHWSGRRSAGQIREVLGL